MGLPAESITKVQKACYGLWTHDSSGTALFAAFSTPSASGGVGQTHAAGSSSEVARYTV